MRLTQFTDYALRTLMYLGTHRDKIISVDEVSQVYDISRNHLVKVVQKLVELRTIEAMRGRGGGMRLIMDPKTLRIGWLVQRTEPDLALVECFHGESSTCPITEVCRLTPALQEAISRFIESLDRYTLADLLEPRERLIELWVRQRAITKTNAAISEDSPRSDPMEETSTPELVSGIDRSHGP